MNHTRDVIKKLIFAMEQNLLNQKPFMRDNLPDLNPAPHSRMNDRTMSPGKDGD